MNNVSIRRATINDQEEIVNLLEGFYPGVPHHWRKIFKPRKWHVEDEFPGFVLVDGEKIVGFLGLIFSQYHIPLKGKTTLCNLTSWYVEPPYRHYSIALYSAVLKLPNVSWTNLTSTPIVVDWLKKIGFQSMGDTQTIFLPLPKLFKKNKEIKLITTVSDHILSAELKQIHFEHKDLCCKPLLIQQHGDTCYCLLVITKYKKIPLAKIYYISNPEFFSEVIEDIRAELCAKLKCAYLLVEGDFLQKKKVFGAWIKKLSPPRLFKSNTLSKEEIRLLNSELFVLGI